MILVDTSVWIDHLAGQDRTMVRLLDSGQVLGHPFVTGEIAMGQLNPRAVVLNSLATLPRPVLASHREVLGLVDRTMLYGIGIGYIDAHLLASARLTKECLLWSRDKRLVRAAMKIGIPIFGI